MSLLKNIWRPDEPPRKGPNPHGDSVLTERLAELLGRELEELQESAASEPRDLVAAAPAEPVRTEERFRAGMGNDQGLGMELAEERLASALRAARAESSEEPRSNGSDGKASIAEATDEAIDRLRAAHVEIEASLRDRVDDYARALETALNGVSREGAAGETPANETVQQFRAEARAWFDEARRELREQLDTSRVSLENQLREYHAELLKAAQQKIESMSSASAATDSEVSQQAAQQAARQAVQEQVERWLKEQGDLSRQQVETGTQNLAKATEEAMARLRTVEERIEEGFRNQVEDYRRAVESAAAELEKKGISQAKFQNAAEELQRMTDQILDRSTKRIEERTEQAMGRLTERLASAEQSLSAAARSAMQGALMEQQQRMAEAWHERTQAAVEAVALAGEQSRTQIEEARRAAEGEFQQAAKEQGRRLVEQVASELQSGEFRERTLGELRRQMEQATRELMARSTAELGKQSELATSRLSNTLDKTTETFLAQVQQRIEAAGPGWLEAAGQAVQKEYQERISRWLDEQTETARRQASEAGRAVEQATERAAGRLAEVSRQTEEALKARLEEQQQRWLESALAKASESGFEQQLVEKALAELDRNASRFLEESTRQLAEQAASARESMAKEMDGASRKLLEGVEASLENISWQHRGRLAQWWEERSQTARREAETAAQTMAQAGQQAASQLRTVQSEIEAELKNRARDHQARLLDSAMEEMRKSGALERTVSEASVALRTSAKEVINRSTQQLRDQVETARMGIENQALAARRGMAEELARKVEQAQSSVENAGKALTEDYRRQLSVWWEERTQSSRRDSEEAVHAISQSASRASEQLQTIQKQITNELQSGMENYRKGLREAAADELRRQGFQRDMLESISAELDKATREMAERSTNELKRQTETGLSGIEEKVQASRKAFLEDSQKKLDEMVGTSMKLATDRFHELLNKNAQELEQEQEEWLQRKRETVWLDINKHSGASLSGSRSASERSKQEGKRTASGGMLGRMVLIALVIAVAAGLTAAFVKFAPAPPTTVMELKTDPPNGFVYENPNAGAQERARELQLGHAYWMIAVNDLQHKYAYNTALPAVPPLDFRVDQNGLRGDAALRMHYWQEMRKIWASPTDWQKTQNGGNQFTALIEWLKNKLTQPQAKAATK